MKGYAVFKRGAALLLAGSLLAGGLCGCSLFEKKAEKKTERERETQIREQDDDEKGDGIFSWPFGVPDVQGKDDEEEPSWEEIDRPTLESTEEAETEDVTFEPEYTDPPLIETEDTEPEFIEPEITEPETTEPVTEVISEFDSFPLGVIHPEEGSGEITASVLNVREYPGEDYEILTGLERGTRVTVYEQVMVGEEPWGRIYEGWVSMKYVAMDDDVVGTWYHELGTNPDTGELRYGFWTFDLTGEFRYVVYAFDGEQVRQESRSGGVFRMDYFRISMEFSYGKEDVTVGGITTSVPGNITLDWIVLGKTMTLKDAQSTTLTRGTVEKLMKQLAAE